ncbi:hypothetical protein RVX_R02200 [Nitratidesulfovibrio sp. HK-II]|uniref:hypothetical protein n=1 Tax=Nitratidesulfovibrio sp. HK-II TaxID=2009266 RepID=UPI0011C050CA|nr:hypothetical protein [Nitratidesulfovibrio sp. HK-II]
MQAVDAPPVEQETFQPKEDFLFQRIASKNPVFTLPAAAGMTTPPDHLAMGRAAAGFAPSVRWVETANRRFVPPPGVAACTVKTRRAP